MGAGEYSGRKVPLASAYIIAADAGYETLIAKGISPDLVVGDFDSLKSLPEHPNIITVPAEKNDTDTSLAIKEGLARGFKTFIVDGGTGGRLDHTFANIQLLKEIAQNDANGILLGKDICLTAIANQTISFKPVAKGFISVFAFGEKAEGVTLEGLKYKLDNATLTDNYPIGTSNEFIGKPATISVRSGTLLITWEGNSCELIINGS
jgi:thiamine pyrophosphokinase